MEKNRLIKYHGTIYRVLAVEDDSILLIDCLERKMPRWYRTEEVDGYVICTEEELLEAAGIALDEEKKWYSSKYDRIASEQFSYNRLCKAFSIP